MILNVIYNIDFMREEVKFDKSIVREIVFSVEK